tara:strand:+ start:433 stop:1050 length:618 start_codon:yes stop_codon:yes gene_type:complete
MLIPLSQCIPYCIKPINGILHVGAHECEEQDAYSKIGIGIDKVIWIDAMKDKVDKYKNIGYNIFNLVISDKDNEDCDFNITNNGQSSSILQLDKHKDYYPHIIVTQTLKMKTSRLDTFINNNNIDMTKYNFINLDIQGVELRALKGLGDYINNIDYIYTEVNRETLYKNNDLINDIDNYLNKYGFSRVLTEFTQQNWGDAFYVKK